MSIKLIVWSHNGKELAWQDADVVGKDIEWYTDWYMKDFKVDNLKISIREVVF